MKKILGSINTNSSLFSDYSKNMREKLFKRMLSDKSFKTKEEKEAVMSSIEESHLRKMAEQGDSISQYYYGRSFLPVDGNISSEASEQIVYWFSRAAEQGDFDAQFELAFMYAKGELVTQNYAQAAHLFCLLNQSAMFYP